MFLGRAKAGFTLLELLMVVMAIGLLGAMIVGGFTNVVPAGREAAAVTKARIVNAARTTYGLTVPGAADQWTAVSTDSDRAGLLVGAGVLNGAAADWLTSSGGYTLSLTGGLRAKTVLKNKAGTALNYGD